MLLSNEAHSMTRYLFVFGARLGAYQMLPQRLYTTWAVSAPAEASKTSGVRLIFGFGVSRMHLYFHARSFHVS